MGPEAIAEKVRQDLLSGRMRPGDTLLQGALAERFGVSRIPVRDALALLARDGLIDVTMNRRATVISLAPAQIEELYDLRLLLETDLLARAVPCMDADALRAVDYALERSNLEARNQNWSEGDALFHDTLYAPAARPRQSALVADLRQKARVQIAGHRFLPEDTDRWLADHAAIVAACHAQNAPQAVSRLRQHLLGAKTAVLERMNR